MPPPCADSIPCTPQSTLLLTVGYRNNSLTHGGCVGATGLSTVEYNCPAHCTSTIVFGSVLHMHQNGVGMQTQQIRNGQVGAGGEMSSRGRFSDARPIPRTRLFREPNRAACVRRKSAGGRSRLILNRPYRPIRDKQITVQGARATLSPCGPLGGKCLSRHQSCLAVAGTHSPPLTHHSRSPFRQG
jgi:hypothetical protein